jgi:hypothetical protein
MIFSLTCTKQSPSLARRCLLVKSVFAACRVKVRMDYKTRPFLAIRPIALEKIPPLFQGKGIKGRFCQQTDERYTVEQKGGARTLML